MSTLKKQLTRYKKHFLTVEQYEMDSYTDLTDMARYLLINKNNCFDWYDSSSWPFSRQALFDSLRPPEAFVPLPIRV